MPPADQMHALTPFYDIAVLSRQISLLLREAMESSELDPMQYAITSAIASGSAVTASRLAEDFGLPLTTITEWLIRLTERGLIERKRDPDDRRRQRLALTADGAAAWQRAQEDFGRAYVAFLRYAEGDPAVMRAVLADMITATRRARADLAASFRGPASGAADQPPPRGTRASHR